MLTIKSKIQEVLNKIDTYEFEPNGIYLFPLCEHIKELTILTQNLKFSKEQANDCIFRILNYYDFNSFNIETEIDNILFDIKWIKKYSHRIFEYVKLTSEYYKEDILNINYEEKLA